LPPERLRRLTGQNSSQGILPALSLGVLRFENGSENGWTVDNGPESTTGSERHRERVREVRRRLAHDGPPWTRDRADDFKTVTVPERGCEALRDLLIAEGVETVVEVGLAYGSSALAIGEALVSVGARRPLHVIIDPLQASEWSNVGWQMIQSAGLGTIARLVLQPSSMALPQFIAEGLTADAAFVDGSHRFHEVFVDLYFLRKIVRPGGVIVLDDQWWPSVRTAARYFELNLGWQAIPGAFDAATIDHQSGHPRLQALRLPNPPFEPAFEHFQPF
jgi:predicted O-methyltransferase YrrM